MNKELTKVIKDKRFIFAFIGEIAVFLIAFGLRII